MGMRLLRMALRSSGSVPAEGSSGRAVSCVPSAGPLGILALLSVCLLQADRTQAAETIVTLANGEQLHADRITRKEDDPSVAVLQVTAPGIVISRKVPWKQIASIRRGNRTWTGDVVEKAVTGTDPGYEIVPRSDSSQGTSREAGVRERKSESGTQRSEVARREPMPLRGPASVPNRPDLLCPPLATPSQVISVRRDPLSAYRKHVARHFPDGVPLSEAGFALHLLRERKARDVLVPRRFVPGGGGRPISHALRHNRTIQSVAVRAVPVSTQGTVEWDALAVRVAAKDADGRPVAFRGTVRATLHGQQQKLVRAYQTQIIPRRGDLVKIARWTRQVDTETGTQLGKGSSVENEVLQASGGAPGPAARFVLPLPRPLPEHDRRVAAFGELAIRLAVPGEGMFEASQPDVPLRHLSQFRDRSLVEHGTRFFPGERTHDSRRRSGIDFFDPSSLGPNSRVLSVQP